jgi:hypothetical protein
VPMSLTPERCPTPARPITPMVKNSRTDRSYQREPLVLKLLFNNSNRGLFAVTPWVNGVELSVEHVESPAGIRPSGRKEDLIASNHVSI